MNFKKDLLLVDLETTGLDSDRHEIIQIAAVLLDKKTLKEKKVFSSYIRPRNWKRRDLASMKVNKISLSQVKNAPGLKEVLKKFKRIFGKNIILSYYVGVLDINFLLESFTKSRLLYPFDYHTFNIWGLFFSFLAKKNQLKSKKDFAGFGLESLIKYFKIKPKGNLHNALTDARVEAEILRKIVKKM